MNLVKSKVYQNIVQVDELLASVCDHSRQVFDIHRLRQSMVHHVESGLRVGDPLQTGLFRHDQGSSSSKSVLAALFLHFGAFFEKQLSKHFFLLLRVARVFVILHVIEMGLVENCT